MGAKISQSNEHLSTEIHFSSLLIDEYNDNFQKASALIQKSKIIQNEYEKYENNLIELSGMGNSPDKHPLEALKVLLWSLSSQSSGNIQMFDLTFENCQLKVHNSQWLSVSVLSLFDKMNEYLLFLTDCINKVKQIQDEIGKIKGVIIINLKNLKRDAIKRGLVGKSLGDELMKYTLNSKQILLESSKTGAFYEKLKSIIQTVESNFLHYLNESDSIVLKEDLLEAREPKIIAERVTKTKIKNNEQLISPPKAKAKSSRKSCNDGFFCV